MPEMTTEELRHWVSLAGYLMGEKMVSEFLSALDRLERSEARVKELRGAVIRLIDARAFSLGDIHRAEDEARAVLDKGKS